MSRLGMSILNIWHTESINEAIHYSCLCSYLYYIAEMSKEQWVEQWVKSIPKPGRIKGTLEIKFLEKLGILAQPG